MKKAIVFLLFAFSHCFLQAQTNPVILSWLQNNTITARHYVAGNSTPINDAALVNVQMVQYNTTNVYIRTTGLPSYVTGPFLDGNPSLATNQNAIFRFPLTPVQNTGNAVTTTPGNIGLFINGVALFDYRDGVAWNATTNALCGGPGNPPCPGGMGATQAWNRDAIVAEKGGFDCAKAHPAMGNYHHHQNPSAFNLDLLVISTVCNLYNADGLYVIDSTTHSPLIGFAYDGFPIYGAYGYQNANGSGPIVRIKSSYQLRNITTRTTSPTGGAVTAGPVVSTTYPLGYFREDYEYIPTTTATPDYLDEHNGRFCVTPEYPNGIYCYFATVDANWNSAYPYVVGPTFYGTLVAAKVTTVPAGTTTYVPSPSSIIEQASAEININVFPNPASELLVVQLLDLNREDTELALYDLNGKLIDKTVVYPGATIGFFDTKTYYAGSYILKISNTTGITTKKVVVTK
ncbi:MAG: YHYH protein [Bacteroidia bacterium]